MVISRLLKSMIVSQIAVRIGAWSQIGRVAPELREEMELWLFGMVSVLRGPAGSSLIDSSSKMD